jgi:hypothetical protein
MLVAMVTITGGNGRNVVVRVINAFKGLEGLDMCGDLY